MTLNEDSRVCLSCAGGDDYIAQEIADNGKAATCDVCGLTKGTLALSELAKMAEDVFDKYVTYNDPEPYPLAPLSTPNELVQGYILECESDALADAIVDYLHDEHEYGVMHDGNTRMYEAHCENYRLEVPHASNFDEEWERFELGVKHRGRFYLIAEKEYLERIFRPLLDGELHRGTPPAETVGAPDSKFKMIYRARVANTEAEQKRILENPPRELAPPPPTLRTAGRMNAAGVIAFYGATDVGTCVAELAVPFGGAAVVGEFRFERPVKVLDLRLLSRSAMAVSWFDPECANKVNYARFMRSLRNKLRKPIMPGAETLDYLPTQMVAEFLATEGFDGVMFVSSVTPEARDEAEEEGFFEVEGTEGDADIARTTGINIVLFWRAALVTGEMGPPVRRIVAVKPLVEFRSPFDNWLYVETAPLPQQEHQPDACLAYPIFDDSIEPTLTLPEDGVMVAIPKSIEYKVATAKPTFSEAKPDANEPF
jgi:RES domain